MNKSVLGIDLGTSSVKILQYFRDGKVKKAKASYESADPKGWWNGICQALSEFEPENIEAISLSSQVGTYIVNEAHVIEWNSRIGTEEVEQIRTQYEKEVFLKEISMAHPRVVSYPIPRLKYIREHFKTVSSVCQPKDYICQQLTGNRVTDPYSWRGLADLNKKCYSSYFLHELGVEEACLPKMKDYTSLAGLTREIDLGKKVLPAGIPVYVGLNDYYASLLGLGIQKAGDLFDISGTSEHLGIIEKETNGDTEMVSGPYLYEHVHYGVTASSGAGIKFGLRLLKEKELSLEEIMDSKPPIFLPYMNGERAPIWNADAKGVFFGISEGCSEKELAYAAFEGVVFSLYHIYESMGCPKAASMKISGGAAVFPVLNRLKAEMFGIPAVILEENDTSALGAAMIAAVAEGWYANFEEAIAESCVIKERIEPTGYMKEWLRKRYSIYKDLYPALKNQYERLKELSV